MMSAARVLLIVGAVLLAAGGILYLAARLNLPFGRLPGDLTLQRGNLTCVFPLASSIIISILLTVVLNLVARLLNK